VIFDAGIFGKDQVKFRELQTGATAILWTVLKKKRKRYFISYCT
jgi:hypothetical protein